MSINLKRKDQKYEYGLVLSGGGTRGVAHLGVIKALEESGIKPDIISGVSAGSIVGALYADGKNPEEIFEAITSHKMFSFLEFTIPKTGLIKMSGFEKTLKKLLKAENFEELNIPLNIFAVNMNTGEYTCFDSGPLAVVVKASSSIPIVFPPVEINGELYTDGGLINNFPLEALEGKCKRIIGVSVNPLGIKRKLDSLKIIAERTFQLNIRSHTLDRKNRCDLFIEPEGLDDYSLIDLSGAEEMFKMGYKTAKKLIKEKGW
ncbi:MAG: patatin-like phospholipase family protein [Bacteroidales bacterium]